MKTKDEVRNFLDSVGIATHVLTEQQAPNAEWAIVADKFHGTQVNLPITKRKGMNKIEITVNINTDEKTKQLFKESEFIQEFDLVVSRLGKVSVARPTTQIPKIVIFRNLYEEFSGQELIDSMEQVVKAIQFIFAFIRKHAKGKTNLETSDEVTQGIG